MSDAHLPQRSTLRAALVGNPNSGKTSLFNQLTGSHQKVANYAGVTVERKEGRFTTPQGREVRLLDLPGAYSLSSTSPDEDVTRDVCLGRHATEQRPELIICVVSASNLRLHLRFLLEIKQLGLPIIVALSMMDEAKKRGLQIDITGLQAELGMPVVPVISLRKDGVARLLQVLDMEVPTPPPTLEEGTDLHAKVRTLLKTYTNEETLGTDVPVDRLVRWLLHPV